VSNLVIDSHQHFWAYDPIQYPWMSDDMNVLRSNHLPEDLRPQLDRVGVDQTVVVQARQTPEENEWVLGMAEEHPWIAGLVGWIDLQADDVEDDLLKWRENPKFVAVRHVVHDEPDDQWLLKEKVVRGLKVLEKHDVPYDLLLRPQHLQYIPELIRQVPNLRMVIDHISKPFIADGTIDPWREEMAALAAYPQICCKVSGMITEADFNQWTAKDLSPYIEIVLEQFGAERLMYGSDWPVCRLAGNYSEVFASIQSGLKQLSANERVDVFGNNAARFYGLNQN